MQRHRQPVFGYIPAEANRAPACHGSALPGLCSVKAKYDLKNLCNVVQPG